MRIAYIITVHKDPADVSRMTRKLLEGSENTVYIHVDGKADIGPYKQALEGVGRVHFLEERTVVRWGGFSQVKAMIALMRAAVADGSYDRIVFTQCQTYPLRSAAEIDAFFAKHPDAEFIGATDMSTIDRSRHQYKVAYRWDLDKATPFGGLVNTVSKIKLRLGLPGRYAKKFIDIDGKKGHFYMGRAYIALTPAAADYCVKFYDTHKSFNKRFSRVYAPDESYFQTVLLNSPFAAASYYGVCPYGDDPKWFNLTVMEYKGSAVVQTEPEFYEKYRDSDWLYFRKFNLPASERLLDHIDAAHRAEAGAPAPADTPAPAGD